MKPFAVITQHALETLSAENNWDLQAQFQLVIWQHLVEASEDENASVVIRAKRRVLLEIEAVRQVLPNWEATFPTLRYPHLLLDEAVRYVFGGFRLSVSQQMVFQEYANWLSEVDNKLLPVEVLQAATSTLTLAVTATTQPKSTCPRQPWCPQ